MIQLLEFDIRRIPGAQPGGTHYKEFGEGVHIIWGPNGSGKSTTCRAIQALLWPHPTSKLHPIWLYSRWKWRGEQWEITREGSQLTIPEPLSRYLNLMPLHAYFFGFDELFEKQERALTDILLNEMHGGYDLATIWERFTLPPRRGVIEVNQIRDLQNELIQVSREHSQIIHRENELSQIEEAIAVGEKMNEEMMQIDRAIACAELQAAIAQASAPTFKLAWYEYFLSAISLLSGVFFSCSSRWFCSGLSFLCTALFLSNVFIRFRGATQLQRKMDGHKQYLEGVLSCAKAEVADSKLLDLSLVALQQRQDELSIEVCDVEFLRQKKIHIERDVESVQIRGQFQRVQERLQTVQINLDKKREEVRRCLLGRAFLKRVEQRFAEERRSAIFQKIQEFFHQFTLGSHALREDQDELWRVWDAHRECVVLPRELSYGIRTQLLLAFRLGFLACAEREIVRFPLFMDEVLCHIDDDRLSNVYETLMEIAKNRQIFLFTCQRWTFESWKRRGAIGIDLEEIAGKKREEREKILLPENRRIAREPFPGETLLDYVRAVELDFPKYYLKLPEQPAWILLESAEEVYRLYSLRVKTVAHLLALPSSEIYSTRTLCLQKILDLLAIGRARPICRSDLEDAVAKGLLSKKFLDPLAECMREVERDAKRLLMALKERAVKRFSDSQIAQLEHYLTEYGLLDRRPPLSAEEIAAEVSAGLMGQEKVTFLISLFLNIQSYFHQEGSLK